MLWESMESDGAGEDRHSDIYIHVCVYLIVTFLNGYVF